MEKDVETWNEKGLGIGLSDEERDCVSNLRRILRLIIQTKRTYKKKKKQDLGGTDIQDDEMSEATQKEDSRNDEYDQDSSISFENGTEITSNQEDKSEDWIEYIERGAREADEKMLTHNITNWIETQKKLKWRQALRIATMDQKSRRVEPRTYPFDKIPKKSRAKRWEDDLKESVKIQKLRQHKAMTWKTTIHGLPLQKRSVNGK